MNEAEMQTAVQTALDEAAEARLEQIKQDMPRFLAESRAFRAGYEQRLYEIWAPALDLYEMIVSVALQAGEAFTQQHRPRAVAEQDYVFDVLNRLHARACLTASEVGALLRTGHATGALARQRTLHELAVVAYVIQEHGQDIAERYLLHEVIESAKIVEEHEQHAARLGQEPYAPEEVAQLRRQRDELCRRFGESYRNQYGWAASALRNRNPTIKDLEVAAGLDHLRPYYRMASHGVHPNPKGIFFNVGNLRPHEQMPAGPSRAGLADPGHGSLISLMHCTIALLNLSPDVETVSTMRAIHHLVQDTGQAFLLAHRNLINAELAIIREEGGREAEEAYLVDLLEDMDGSSES